MKSVSAKSGNIHIGSLVVGMSAAIAIGWAWHASQMLTEAEDRLREALEERNVASTAAGPANAVPGTTNLDSSAGLQSIENRNDERRAPGELASLPRERSVGPPSATERERAVDEARQNEPEYFGLFQKAQHARIASRYAPFFQNVGLSASEIDAFEKLMVAEQEYRMDVEAGFRVSDLERDGPVARSIREQNEQRLRTALMELLGESRYRRLQEFYELRPVRGVVGGLARRLAETGPSMNREAADQLSATIADNTISRDGGTEIDWKAVRDEASQWISADQLQQLTSLIEEREHSKTIRRMLKEIREGGIPEAVRE